MGNEAKGYVYILTNPAFRENWVKIGKSTQGSHFLINNRIIFHGARAQRIEPVVHTKVTCAMISIMAHNSHLVTFRKSRIFCTTQIIRNIGC